jgi:prophage regulatory protein
MAPRQTQTTPAELDRLLTTREVMQRLTLSRSTLWRMSRDGEIPRPIQLTPTRIAWRERDVLAWLDARAAQHNSPEAA